MIFRKRKGRSKEKKASKRRVLVSLLILGAVASVALWIYLSRAIKIPPPPIYEETYPVATDLSHEIAKIDGAIYEALYQEGISEKDILFLAVKPRYEGDHAWEFTELMVRLTEGQPNRQFDKIVTRVTSVLRPAVRLQKEEVSNTEIVCHLFGLGFYTHKIRLTTEEYQKPSPHRELPRIAIVVDDMGYDLEIAKSFIHLDLPLTFSVLPLAPHTAAIVEKAHANGRELILHLPMEPRGYPHLNPGPGALLKGMKEDRIRMMVDDYLKSIPGVRGVNNHMGSRFTEMEDKMTIIMSELKKRHLFYLDSKTSGQSVALKLAERMGVPATSRSVFLDNDLSPKSIKFQIERLLGIAKHTGYAIGICHPHKETLRCLQDSLHRLQSDVRIVPASELAGLGNSVS